MTTLNTLPTEYAAITARLEDVGNRFRLANILRALAGFLAFTMPATLAILFAAGFFKLPPWAHIVLLLLWLAIMVVSYIRLLHQPVFHRPSYAAIARLIEENAPSRLAEPLDNSLINAVLLAQELESPTGGHPWIPQLLREATAHTGALPLEKSVPWSQPRNAWFAAAAVLLVCGLFVAFSPGSFFHGFAVLAQPTRFVPQQGTVHILAVTPGNDSTIAGQSLAFSATVDVPDHKTVPTTLQIHYASGKTATFPMLPFGSDNNQYNRQDILAAEDMDYIITAGDTQSERYHITVLPQIHLVDYALDAAPPAYTHRPHQTVHLSGQNATAAKGSLEAPLGSDISLAIALDAPAKEVLLDIAGGNPLPLSQQGDGRTFLIKFPLKETLNFSLRINDGGNRTLKQFPEQDASQAGGTPSFYTLTATPDTPPTIAVANPNGAPGDLDAKPGDKLPLSAQATDDYGLTQVRLEAAKNEDKEFKVLQTWPIAPAKDNNPSRAATVRYTLDLPAGQFKFGDTLRYRFLSTDNRDLTALDPALSAQTTTGQIFTITLNDTSAAAVKTGKVWDELRAKLMALLDRQIDLRKQAAALVATLSINDVRKITTPISTGQKSLQADMAALAKDFPFEPSMKLIQKSLQVLVIEDAASAIDRSSDILLLSDSRSLTPLATRLRQHQSRIIDVLQTLLAIIEADQTHLARTADHEGGDLPNDAKDAWRKLADDLKTFAKEQKAVIDATADLAKKPKDSFDSADQKKLADLTAMEDKWEKFLNDRLADMSKLAQQDQANSSLLEEMVQMKVELAAAKDALQAKATEIATPLEENGLENAQALTSHIERWLEQTPDRTAWQMEEPVTQNDPAMAELPKQLQDMTGDLMDKEEDLTDQMESLASKYADSMDKGAGWGAADGPISNMSAQGVTGNQLPKNNEIQGRSGEGREGQASGEMVGSTAEGKEGRRTPTRLTNDPFSNSQVDDKSTLPEGGATGGGKKGGLGGEGLEGPAPADDPNMTQRLAGQQATIQNEAERLALQMHAAAFDNFKLIESNAYLKKSEDALKQYHYQTALYYQQQAVQSLNTAKVLATGQVSVITDTTPKASDKTRKDVESALNGPLPKGYADPVKAYFEKLATENPSSP